MVLDPAVFKAYDIRGIYPKQLDQDAAEDIARGFATLLQHERADQELTVAVGRDMRLSSPALHARVIKGLMASGINVVDVGLVSSPTFYFAVAFHGYAGGMQISASHNPKEYNGLKLVRAGGVAISRDTGMIDLKELVLGKKFIVSPRPGKLASLKNVTDLAVREQTKDINLKKIRPLKIVVDAANAMGAVDIEAMFKDLPCSLVKLNFKLDGSFPVHQPDPLDPKNLVMLQQAVKAHRADLGIAPDGDGDRVFFVDERGQVVRQEILRGIMAQIALQEHPGATVCYDIRPGRITRDMIEAAGGKAVVTPVGHSLIKSVMVKAKAVFGGESSGHYFYRFPYGTFESPITLIMKFLAWLSGQNTSLAEAIRPYQKYFHSGEINSKVAGVHQVLERVKQRYADGQQNLLDGVSVEYGDWWFNVRGSNTEPLIRLNLEAKTPELMQQKRDEVLAVIRAGA